MSKKDKIIDEIAKTKNAILKNIEMMKQCEWLDNQPNFFNQIVADSAKVRALEWVLYLLPSFLVQKR